MVREAIVARSPVRRPVARDLRLHRGGRVRVRGRLRTLWLRFEDPNDLVSFKLWLALGIVLAAACLDHP